MPFSGSTCGWRHQWWWGSLTRELKLLRNHLPRDGLCVQTAANRVDGAWWTPQQQWPSANAEFGTTRHTVPPPATLVYQIQPTPAVSPWRSSSLPLWSLTSPSSFPEGPWLIKWFCSHDVPYLELKWFFLFLLFWGTWEEKETENVSQLGAQHLH